MEKVENTIGANIKALREGGNISQDKLANDLHISRMTVGKYERSERIPDAILLRKLADYFHVTTDYFFEIGGDAKSANKEIGLTGPNINLISQKIANTQIPTDYQSRDKRSLLDVLNQFLSDINFYDLLCAFQIATGYLPSHKRPGYDKSNGVVYETNDDSIHELFMRKRVHTLIDAIMDNVQELAAASPEETPRTKKVKFMNGKVIIETDSK